MRTRVSILAGMVIAAIVAAGTAWADQHPDKAGAAASRPAPPGSTLSAQQRLAARLDAIRGSSLSTAISHNRAEWDNLSPDQRSRFRQEALAFLDETPEQQDRLMKRYQKLISLSAQRQEDYRQIASWLKVVVDSMTPDEKKALLEMSPEKRAKAILARKAELIEQGKLPAEASSQPAE